MHSPTHTVDRGLCIVLTLMMGAALFAAEATGMFATPDKTAAAGAAQGAIVSTTTLTSATMVATGGGSVTTTTITPVAKPHEHDGSRGSEAANHADVEAIAVTDTTATR